MQYPSILERALEDMTHAEAEEEVGEQLVLMLENIREQNDQLNELFGIEEFMSKQPKSSTKRSTYQPSDSMSMYGASSVKGSVISNNTSMAKTAKALKYDSKMSKHEDRKLERIAAEA